ncbi:hypothetical protein V8C86DRAFT_2798499 [Haematococcus lacustris]
MSFILLAMQLCLLSCGVLVCGCRCHSCISVITIIIITLYCLSFLQHGAMLVTIEPPLGHISCFPCC